MSRLLGALVIVLLVVAALSFTVLNAAPVPLNYYLGILEVPLALVVVLPLAVGALCGVLVSLGVIVRLKRRVVRLERRVGQADQDAVDPKSAPAHNG